MSLPALLEGCRYTPRKARMGAGKAEARYLKGEEKEERSGRAGREITRKMLCSQIIICWGRSTHACKPAEKEGKITGAERKLLRRKNK